MVKILEFQGGGMDGGSSELLPQHVFLDLAHGIAWQVVDEIHALGDLEIGEGAFKRLDDAGFGQRRAGLVFLAHHGGRDGLTEVGVGQPDHGRFDHSGHGIDDFLDLLRIDVEPAGDDEILRTADDQDVVVASRWPRSPVLKKPSTVNSAAVFSGICQ